MTHAVVRGKPNEAQKYLDAVLDSVLEREAERKSNVKERNEINLASLLFYSMKNRPTAVYMINGSTGEKFTSEYILKRSVSLARALVAGGAKKKNVVLVTKNHQQMAILYYGILFADVLLIMLDPNSTVYELQHFLKMLTPLIVFCDPNRYDDLITAVQDLSEVPKVVAADDDTLEQLSAGQSNDLESFIRRAGETAGEEAVQLRGRNSATSTQLNSSSEATKLVDDALHIVFSHMCSISDASVDSTAMMLPTSGSTGLPKATLLSHRGLVAQIPSLWTDHSKFPRPTELVMLVSTAQWMTHTLLMTTCPVYQIPLVMSPKAATATNVLEMIEKFQPTWTLLGPAFSAAIASAASVKQLASLEILMQTGSPSTPEIVTLLKEKIPATAQLYNGFGMTETCGFVAIPNESTPMSSTGKLLNIFQYKLVGENGEELGANQKGELYLKSDYCIFEGYYNQERTCVTTDGWLMTDDIFYRDENENMFYVSRKKFTFKYQNYHVSPEELERVIGSVGGVQECVVCDSATGPAAAIVLRPGCVVSEQQIHETINSTLSNHKRLRGGIVFLDTLPHTASGKIHRMKCSELMKILVRAGQGCSNSSV